MFDCPHKSSLLHPVKTREKIWEVDGAIEAAARGAETFLIFFGIEVVGSVLRWIVHYL